MSYTVTVPDREGMWIDAHGMKHLVVKALEPWGGYDGSLNEFLIYADQVEEDTLLTILDAASDGPYVFQRELEPEDFPAVE